MSEGFFLFFFLSSHFSICPNITDYCSESKAKRALCVAGDAMRASSICNG